MEPKREDIKCRADYSALQLGAGESRERYPELTLSAAPPVLDLRIAAAGAQGWQRVLDEEKLPTEALPAPDAARIIIAPLTAETLESAQSDLKNAWVLEARSAVGTLEAQGFHLPPVTSRDNLPVSRFGRAVIIQANCSEQLLRANNETVNEALDTMRQALRVAHEVLEVPYIHLWYYPKAAPTGFLFRVDVDYVVPEALEKFAELSERFGIKGTYFVNVSGEEEYEDTIGQGMLERPTTPDRLTQLRAIQARGNEIANHGYWHNVFPDAGENTSNIDRAQRALFECFGLQCVGFAAPGAESTDTLGAALSDFGFRYVANTLADNGAFPYKPSNNSTFYEMPGCSLSDLGLEGVGLETDRQTVVADVVEFYRSLIAAHIESGLPVSLIVHPHLAGHCAEALLAPIFELIAEHGIPSFTHSEFESWWRRRAEAKFEVVSSSAGERALHCEVSDAVVEVLFKGERRLIKLRNDVSF
jgi:hypothetical protein